MFEIFKKKMGNRGQISGPQIAVGVILMVICVGVIGYSIVSDLSTSNQANSNLSSTDKLIWKYLPTFLLLLLLVYFGYLMYQKR